MEFKGNFSELFCSKIQNKSPLSNNNTYKSKNLSSELKSFKIKSTKQIKKETKKVHKLDYKNWNVQHIQLKLKQNIIKSRAQEIMYTEELEENCYQQKKKLNKYGVLDNNFRSNELHKYYSNSDVKINKKPIFHETKNYSEDLKDCFKFMNLDKKEKNNKKINLDFMSGFFKTTLNSINDYDIKKRFFKDSYYYKNFFLDEKKEHDKYLKKNYGSLKKLDKPKMHYNSFIGTKLKNENLNNFLKINNQSSFTKHEIKERSKSSNTAVIKSPQVSISVRNANKLLRLNLSKDNFATISVKDN